jgi:hypothetical protein
VLYLNDGQNLFDAATSTFTGREWRVDETVRELTGRPHPADHRRRYRPRRPARAIHASHFPGSIVPRPPDPHLQGALSGTWSTK